MFYSDYLHILGDGHLKCIRYNYMQIQFYAHLAGLIILIIYSENRSKGGYNGKFD
jgi:hypothetical protein